jgi:putative RNA 2'-phosphotransferase
MSKQSHDPFHQASKFLSLILRHDPAAGGVTLDAQGWVSVDDLLAGMSTAGSPLTLDELHHIVDTDNKGRYSIVSGMIRANQGHSIDVDLGLVPQTPPAELFHGTAQRFLESILASGLLPGQRQYVHLSSDKNTAITVGQRHGTPVVLRIDAARMQADGVEFLVSENGVWLTSAVRPEYLATDGSIDR